MLFSQLKGKKVYSLNNAEMIGCVEAAYIDKNGSNIYLKLSIDNNIISLTDIFGVSDILTVRSFNNIEIPLENCSYYDNTMTIYDVEGKILSSISDLSLSKPKAIIVNDTYFNINLIVSSSKDIMFLNPNRKRLVKRAKTIKNVKKIEISTDIFENKEENKEVFIEKAVISEKSPNDYSFLLQRTVMRPITDLTGSLFIESGTVITEEVIENARRVGKLVDLTINSEK